jgi:hypothetical protein
VENGDGDVGKSQRGKLILHAIPTKEAEDMVVSYLARKVRNVPAEKLAQKIRKTPFVLSKNIAAAKGQKIAHNLRDLGARAEFVPLEPRSRMFEGLSDEVATPDTESVQVTSEHYQAPRQKPPQSSRAGKKLMTVIVVVVLVAVFALLTWQLHHLLTAKIFQ